MKRETTQRKLLEALGMDVSQFTDEELGVSKQEDETEKVVANKSGLPVGMTLEQYESYRGGQATALFLQAPELFTAALCKHCGEAFLVSRTLVAFCTYDCTQRELAKSGIDWQPKIDEEYIKRVWNNNEPLRVPPKALAVLQEIAQEQSQPSQEAQTA